MFRNFTALSAAIVLSTLVAFTPVRADDPVSDPYDPPGGTLPTLGELAVDALLLLARFPGLSSWVTLP